VQPLKTGRLVHDFLCAQFFATATFSQKCEFRCQQFDNKDFQTSPMAQYQGCGRNAPPSAAVSGCPIQVVNSATSPTPILSPNGTTGFYPYFQVVDPSAARYLFSRSGSAFVAGPTMCRRRWNSTSDTGRDERSIKVVPIVSAPIGWHLVWCASSQRHGSSQIRVDHAATTGSNTDRPRLPVSSP
jgi:hypothetical protein